MSMDGIRVNHGELDGAVDNLNVAVGRIDERLNQLENELAPLKSDWSGNAQLTYTQAKAKWDNAIGEMKLLLQDTSNAVRDSNQSYKDADKRGAAAFEI